ncbi:hypothetical protein C8Q76DRAFT_758677 [Earliella scabrosa]|nr:hypothetical protein C8Q76DRAFT_758677 [Earliella scabrosa]
MAQFVHYTAEDIEQMMAASREASKEMIAECDAVLLDNLSIHTWSIDGVDKYASSVVDRRYEFQERCQGWLADVATPSASVIADLEDRVAASSNGDGFEDEQGSEDKQGSESEDKQGFEDEQGSDDDAESMPSEQELGHYGKLVNAQWSTISSEDEDLDDGAEGIFAEVQGRVEDSGTPVKAASANVKLPKVILKLSPQTVLGGAKQAEGVVQEPAKPAKPAKKRARLSAENAKGKQKAQPEPEPEEEEEESSEDEAVVPQEADNTTKKRKHASSGRSVPKKTPISTLQADAARSADGELSFTVAAFVNIELPAKLVQPTTARGTAKIVAQPPIQYGPFQIDNRTSWNKTVKEMARTVRTEPENIVVPSLRWTWDITSPNRPRGAKTGVQWLPLKDAAAFAVLMESIRKAAKGGSLSGNEIILISMAQPLSAFPSQYPPWVTPTSPYTTFSGSSAPPAPMEAPGIMHGMSSFLVPGSTRRDGGSKKPTLDESLAPIVERLKETYPIGCCALHPGIRCFHYSPMDWHFDLDNAKLKVWANGILSGMPNINFQCPPLGSRFFSAASTIKVPAALVNHHAPPPGPPPSFPPPGHPFPPPAPPPAPFAAVQPIPQAMAAPHAAASPWMAAPPPGHMMHAFTHAPAGYIAPPTAWSTVPQAYYVSYPPAGGVNHSGASGSAPPQNAYPSAQPMHHPGQ